MRHVAAVALLCAAVWPAAARGDDDVFSVPPNKCLTLAIVKQRLTVEWPQFILTEFDAEQSGAIRQGLIRAGAELSLLDEWEFSGLTAEGNTNVLVLGFKHGCYEGARSVSRDLLHTWLAGDEAEKAI